MFALYYILFCEDSSFVYIRDEENNHAPLFLSSLRKIDAEK